MIHVAPGDIPHYILNNLSYAGRKLRINPTETYTIPSTSGTWSSGSRTLHQAIRLSSGQILPLSDTHSHPASDQRKDRTIDLSANPDIAIVERITFQGRDHGLVFHIAPEAATNYLPPSHSLTPLQLGVLYATRRYKPSYNGKDRYDHLIDDLQSSFGPRDPVTFATLRAPNPLPTRHEFLEARQSLIDQGYLNKMTALTIKGRNAADAL